MNPVNAKKLMPCLYLYQKRAVAGPTDRREVSLNPAGLAENYSLGECDRLYVMDLSETDQEQEEAMDILREICAAAVVPVVGGGRIRRMEDVKKLLYAGCSQAVLDLSKEEQAAVLEEVSLKFGKEKIIAAAEGPEQILKKQQEIAAFASEVFLFHGAGGREASLVSPVPVTPFLPEVSLDKIMEMLALPNIGGLSGQVVTENADNIGAIKKLCLENGIFVTQFRPSYRFSDFKTGPDGLVPVVVQDAKTDAVLMVAYMNEEAYERTIEGGRMTYYSRSRRSLWLKGETSGHYQYVHSLTADCDMDTILARVTQVGAACHTGSYSCFFNEILSAPEGDGELPHNPAKVFENQFRILAEKWKQGLETLKEAAEEVAEAEKADFADVCDMAEVSYCHLRSTYLQTAFVRAVNNGGCKACMKAYAEEEIALALRLAEIVRRDSRIGFEASNHYYYTLNDLYEKVISCAYIIERLEA